MTSHVEAVVAVGPVAAALERLHEVSVDEATVRSHVMKPSNLSAVKSDRGRQDAPEPAARLPRPRTVYHLNVQGFADALQDALKSSVAGYTMRLHQNGSTIWTWEWNWAKEPQDAGEGWTPDVRMHVASLSKIVTTIAMAKLLDAKGISYDAPIIGHLPAYWVKGPGVDRVTFAELFIHTSGFAYGVDTSASDFEFMKSEIAAGTTHIGQYCYQNMNFGLCRILLATINGNIPVDLSFSGPLAVLDDPLWDTVCISAYESYVTFRRKGTIVTAAQAQTVLDGGFGVDWAPVTELGRYYAKNGFWQDGSGQMEQGVAFYLPGQMELVVLVNSPVGAADHFLYSLVAEAYTDNIVGV